jgi:hypothetical protein
MVDIRWLRVQNELWQGTFYDAGEPLNDGKAIRRRDKKSRQANKEFRQLAKKAARYSPVPSPPTAEELSLHLLTADPADRWLEAVCGMPFVETGEGTGTADCYRLLRLADVFTASAMAMEKLAEFPPPGAKPGEGERNGGAALTPEERKAAWERLERHQRRAYLAWQHAEGAVGRHLQDGEAYDWLKENGIDQDKGDLGELADYELPPSPEDFTRYLSAARKALRENKYTRRGGRKHGRSIARQDEIEYHSPDNGG